MENGTVRVFRNGKWLEGKMENFEVNLSKLSSGSRLDEKFEYRILLEDFPKPMDPQPIDINHPEPFNDGEYLHYTRFHPQLQDMIGTKGYFYDDTFMDYQRYQGFLNGVSSSGFPECKNDGYYAYFAVPIKTEKTEITLQEIADKFGVSVEQIRIKE